MKRNLSAGSDRSKVIGSEMTVAETELFLRSFKKRVVTFFGYSVDYEDEDAMLAIAGNVLSEYPPETVLINIGGTSGGIGAIYPLAKAKGFTTTGIVSSQAIEHFQYISKAVDHVCFVLDIQWGGKLPGSNGLSPTSQAMVLCSDEMIAIGGGEVTREELIAGKERGIPVRFYPAEVSHKWLIQQARHKHLPPPDSFWGATHEVFGKRDAL
jgi:hypothetical protein